MDGLSPEVRAALSAAMDAVKRWPDRLEEEQINGVHRYAIRRLCKMARSGKMPASKQAKEAKGIVKAEAARLVHERMRFAPTQIAAEEDVRAFVFGPLGLPPDGPGGAIVSTVTQSNEELVNAAEQAAVQTAVDRRRDGECAGTCCARRSLPFALSHTL